MTLSIEEKLKRRRNKLNNKIKNIEKEIKYCIENQLIQKREYYFGYLDGLKESLKLFSIN